MSQVLLYSRPKTIEPMADQTVCILAEQLQFSGHQVDIANTLNIPRLILNSYETIHLVLENLPMTASEALHLGICKALGKNTLVSILNSDRNLKKGFLNFVKPDAISVSQTNHLKYYRAMAGNKFVLPAFLKKENPVRKSAFKHDAFLIPLSQKLEEAFDFNINSTVYFDGRKLLNKKTNSIQLRKKWNDLVGQRSIKDDYHLILSDNKIKELIEEPGVSVVLADSSLSHTEFTSWLSLALNKNNLVILNEYQATGFSSYWTSGRNCFVVPVQSWVNSIAELDMNRELTCTTYKASELFEPVVNELSRLYSKLSQQKTTLLTSRSVKL
jgi:hypothetical protein